MGFMAYSFGRMVWVRDSIWEMAIPLGVGVARQMATSIVMGVWMECWVRVSCILAFWADKTISAMVVASWNDGNVIGEISVTWEEPKFPFMAIRYMSGPLWDGFCGW